MQGAFAHIRNRNYGSGIVCDRETILLLSRAGGEHELSSLSLLSAGAGEAF